MRGELSWQQELAAVFRSVHDLLVKHPDIPSAAPGNLGRRQAVLERLPRDDFENLSRLS